MRARSGGAFDVTVQPLWELYFEAKKRGVLPADGAIDAARAKVDWTKVSVKDARVSFGAPGMKLTFNGIAQGYITNINSPASGVSAVPVGAQSVQVQLSAHRYSGVL